MTMVLMNIVQIIKAREAPIILDVRHLNFIYVKFITEMLQVYYKIVTKVLS